MTDSQYASSVGFTPVKTRRNRKNKLPVTVSTAVMVSRLREQLRQDAWFVECSKILDDAWRSFSSQSSSETPCSFQILCLGLGSPTSSQIARVQLAFLAETCTRLTIDRAAISLYDPVFTEEDHALFQDLQMQVLTENRNGDYRLKDPMLCFMPHCDIDLYESLLKANWSRVGLEKVFVLGNQFRDYIDNKPTSELETKYPCLLRLAPLIESHPLPISSAWPTAFNNTAAQFPRVPMCLAQALASADSSTNTGLSGDWLKFAELQREDSKSKGVLSEAKAPVKSDSEGDST